MKSPQKLTNITTPIQGCRSRAIWPPPKSPVRKKRLGWKSARPESASSTRQTAVIQWLIRAGTV